MYAKNEVMIVEAVIVLRPERCFNIRVCQWRRAGNPRRRPARASLKLALFGVNDAFNSRGEARPAMPCRQ